MKKKVGALYCKVIDVCPGWIDVQLKTSGTATVFFKTNLSDTLKTAMESFKGNGTLINLFCVKNKHGDFMFSGYKVFAAQTRAQKTNRIKAQADMAIMERENYSPVRGKNIAQKAAKHSLAAKKGSAKVTRVIGALVSGAVAQDQKPKETKLHFLP